MRFLLTDSTSSVNLLDLPFLPLQFLNTIFLLPFPLSNYFTYLNCLPMESTVFPEPPMAVMVNKFMVLRSLASTMAELFYLKHIGFVFYLFQNVLTISLFGCCPLTIIPCIILIRQCPHGHPFD